MASNHQTHSVYGKKTLLVMAFVVVCGGMLLVQWFLPFSPRYAPIVHELRPEAIAVAPGIYLLGEASPAAVYLIETSQGLVLIDAGLDANAVSIKRQLAKLGFQLKDLKAILLTHIHGDHSLGATHLRALSHAKIYAGQADADFLRQGNSREAFFSKFEMPDSLHSTPVDVELNGGEKLEFSETHISVIAAPGHTPGGICYLLERDGFRVLFSGDVIQNLSRPAHGLMGTYVASLPPLYRGNATAYLTTLQELRSMPVPDLVLPGHPRMDETPQNPHLSETRWRALLDIGISELQQILVRFENDGADFLDGTPRELLPGLSYLGNVGVWGVYCITTKLGLVVINAPGKCNLVDFISNRLKELGQPVQKIYAVLMTSITEDASDGLEDLINQTGCRVVVPKGSLDVFRQRIRGDVQWLTEDSAAAIGNFKVRTLSVVDTHGPSLAYLFQVEGKSVLATGAVPVMPRRLSLEQLRLELKTRSDRSSAYIRSLKEFRNLRPDLWLPAFPEYNQNANLYDSEWLETLEQNGLAILR